MKALEVISPASYTPFDMDNVLLDLELRFLYTLPESELQMADRLFFHVEQAHWFYEDFIAERRKGFQSFGLKEFAGLLFAHCPLFSESRNDLDALFKRFWTYRQRIPVFGCIMLNQTMDKFVLVRNYKGNSWGFPKGKLNEVILHSINSIDSCDTIFHLLSFKPPLFCP